MNDRKDDAVLFDGWIPPKNLCKYHGKSLFTYGIKASYCLEETGNKWCPKIIRVTSIQDQGRITITDNDALSDIMNMYHHDNSPDGIISILEKYPLFWGDDFIELLDEPDELDIEAINKASKISYSFAKSKLNDMYREYYRIITKNQDLDPFEQDFRTVKVKIRFWDYYEDGSLVTKEELFFNDLYSLLQYQLLSMRVPSSDYEMRYECICKYCGKPFFSLYRNRTKYCEKCGSTAARQKRHRDSIKAIEKRRESDSNGQEE